MNNKKIIEYSKKFGIPILRPKTSELLVKKLNKNNPKTILEIGTAIGYSTKIISNNTNSKIFTIDHNKNYLKIAKKHLFFEILCGKVKIIYGDCLVKLSKMLLKEKFLKHFDFIFIDGPKAQYSKILDLCLPLLNENGIIFIDDILFHGYTEKNTNKRFKTINNRMLDFIEKCKNCQDLVKFELINIEDGIIIATKRKNDE